MHAMVLGIGMLGLATLATTAHTATPAQGCQAGKNKAAGKYASCRHNAAATLAKTGDTAKYGEAIAKCEAKFGAAWSKQESTAAAKGGSCLDGAPTAPQFKGVIDDETSNVSDALGGAALVFCGNGAMDGIEACDGSDLGGKTCADFGFAGGALACTTGCALDPTACTPIVCGNGAIDPGEQCDQDNLNGESCASLGYSFGSLACAAGCIFNTTGCYSPPRLTDNGDGTITDHETGLVWEKKAALNNVAVNCPNAAACPNPHDADNRYTWTDSDIPTALPTGTAYTVFLAQLNAGGGFAGHNDWRLPTLPELQGLVDYLDATAPMVDAVFDTGCTGACTVTTCSCASPDDHWSATSVASVPADAWVVNLGNGTLVTDTKDTHYNVRAVRNGP